MAISKRTKKALERWLNMGQFPGSELGERETGFRHRNYYHKHFQGYTEIRHVNENGAVVSERIYTAPWYHHKTTNKQWILAKTAYFGGVLISSILFLWALTQRIPSNVSKLVAVPGYATVVLMILMWMSVFAYITAPRKMTLWEYRSGKSKIELFTRLAVVGLAATALAKVLFICFAAGFAWTGEFGSIAALLLSAIPLLLIFLYERKMPYEELENENTVTDEERYDIQ